MFPFTADYKNTYYFDICMTSLGKHNLNFRDNLVIGKIIC